MKVTEDVGEDSTGMKPLMKRRKMREVQEKGDNGATRWTRKGKAVDEEETGMETEERRQSVSKEEEEEKSVSKGKKPLKPVEVKEEVGEDSSEIKPLMKQRDSKRKMRGSEGRGGWSSEMDEEEESSRRRDRNRDRREKAVRLEL